MGMGSGGISLSSRGEAGLKGKNGIEIDMLHGKQVMLKAKEYIYIQCGMSAVAVLPGEIHLKGTQVYLDSPLSEKTETVLSDSSIATMKEMYYNMKWGSPFQLFMPDGTMIGREKGLEQNAALRKYFEENVLGTEGYENYMDAPALKPLYEDGTLDPAEIELYKNSLYLKWLSATYGKTDMEKLGDWLMTKEGRHAALDVVGIFFDGADVVNAVLYLAEGDWGNAALSGICALPLLGDFLGKAGKGTKYLLKLTDLSKLKRNEKVSDTLKRLDIFFKARRADISDLHKWIRKSWDDLLGGGGYAAEYVTPDGMIYRIRTSDDFRVNINLMDEAGDMTQDMLQAGRKADNVGELAINGGSHVVTGIKLPQGISPEMFSDASKLIKENIGDISGNIVVQGSRASGTAKPTSDIDIAVRVTSEKFDELIQKSFGTPNSGTAKERTMLHAIETGKIQAGEAGLRGLRKELEKIFGMEVDISIIEIDGPFDNPPFIPIE